MSNNQRAYWVGFNLVKGVGAVRFQALLDTFGDAEKAWRASPAALMSAGLSQKIVANLVEIRSKVDPEKYWEGIQKRGFHVITWLDEAYPRLLKEVDQPPPVLYVLGELRPEDGWSVAIVGTRRVTAYGRQVAEEVAGLLARNGVTVVSGLARGVDAAAHQAALACSGRTIAVLGSGIDRIYPPEHRKLAERIVAQGAVISDYPPGTPPEATNFPPRNRIISGLSRAVVVVEAGETSGALITAKFAAEQGRDVFAVPGSINAPQSQGANRLIRDGAIPLLNPADVLKELDMTMVNEQQAARLVLPGDPTESRILGIVGREPIHVDEIRSLSGMPIEIVTATLTMMELKGMVRQVGGMNYVAVRENPDEYRTSGSPETREK